MPIYMLAWSLKQTISYLPRDKNGILVDVNIYSLEIWFTNKLVKYLMSIISLTEKYCMLFINLSQI